MIKLGLKQKGRYGIDPYNKEHYSLLTIDYQFSTQDISDFFSKSLLLLRLF